MPQWNHMSKIVSPQEPQLSIMHPQHAAPHEKSEETHEQEKIIIT
jgi:hypothetical protein